MEIIRKTNILIKTERKFVIHQQARGQIWCELCAEPMVTAQTAAVLYGTGTRAVYRLIEEGNIHFVENEDETFVCPNSAKPALPAR